MLSVYPSLCSEQSPHYSLTTLCAVPQLPLTSTAYNGQYFQLRVFMNVNICGFLVFCKQHSSLQAKHKTWHVCYKQIQRYSVLTIQLSIWLLLRLKDALLLLAGLHSCDFKSGSLL